MPDDIPFQNIYNPNLDIWPDLKQGRVLLRPSRVGVNNKTGKVMIGFDHVEQSIARIFATRYHQRPLRRWVGCFLLHLLGQEAVQRAIARFYWAIITAIDLYEPNYRIKRVRVGSRKDGSNLTSAEELRRGILTVQHEGIYRPRAHLGDDTPEERRRIGLVGKAYGPWDPAKF